MDIKKYFSRKALLLYRHLLIHKIAPYSFMDDKAFLEYKFLQKLGFPLDLRDPKSFNEKLNWMKLYDRDPLYTVIVDKYLVRDYVSEKIGEKYLTQLLGLYDTPDEIDWDSLPDKFALKVNNGCKFNILCKDKAKLDIPSALEKLRVWVKDNGYTHAREWPYKDVKTKILCEEFLEGDSEWGLLDYKFFCFNGEPVYVAVDFDRFTYHTQYFYDLNWQRQPFVQGLPTPDRDAPKPDNFDEMVGLARTLSENFPFLRVDLYNFKDKVYFGELTLHPAADFKMITPEEYEWKLGEMVTLKPKPNHRKSPLD